MNFIKKIFCRRKQFKPQPKQLRIDGCKTELTPIPDDAELAAQALLESRIYGDKTQRRKKQPLPQSLPKKEGERDAEYYRQLSEKIKESHKHDARMATRFVSYCEEQLKLVQGSGLRVQDSSNHDPLTVNHAPESIATLERGLYKHQDTVEREGGELLKRWQKCLAECIVRQMGSDEKENKQ